MGSLNFGNQIKQLEEQIALQQQQMQQLREAALVPGTAPVPGTTPTSTGIPPVHVNPQVPTMESIEEAVRKVVHQELGKISGAPIAPTQPAPMDYGTQLLMAIGTGLTEEQQVWLSHSENQSLIPEFLASKDGQAFTKRFFTFYKDFKEQACKSSNPS